MIRRVLTASALLVFANACKVQPPSARASEPDHAVHGAEALASAMPGMPGPEHAGHQAPASPTSSAEGPPGYAAIVVDPARAAAAGLTTAPVEDRALTKRLRTTGVVALDETRTAHVHAKVRGSIEGISVDFVGQQVKRGAALCSIYSQEVFSAELEFLALLDRSQSQPIPTGELAEGEVRAREQLLASARRRISLWDVPKAEVARLEATREARRTFTLSAPRAGVVVAKQAILGTYVDPSVELYTLSDLSRVWVLADVYEADLPYVHVGDKVTLALEGRESPIEGALTFLPPTIDEATRTLKARIELDNREGIFRPGAFVSVIMDLDLGKGLVVPENAVIRTGTRAIVFVSHGEHLEPRDVVLGPLVGGVFRVTSGLSGGELVATGAQFLLDSESRLRATSAGGGHAHSH